MTYGSFTPPGFDEDRYDESDRAPLTDEQVAAMNEVWPQYAKPNTASVVCPYCNNPARFVDNAEIYGKRYGTSYMAYWCKPCDARVGVHENDPARPLGTMANAELRQWRQKAHAAIDPIWKDGWMRRKKVYQCLSDAFGYEVHIGESDSAQCQVIIDTAERLLMELKSDPYEKNSWADGHPMNYGDS